MIVSHRHRFIFVKGRKVAGTSIEMLLSKVCGPEDILTPLLPIDERARGGVARNYSTNPSAEAAFRQVARQVDAADLARLRAPRGRFFNHMGRRDILARLPEVAAYRIIVAERSPYAKLLSWLNMGQSIRAYSAGGAMRGNPARFERQFDRMHAANRLIEVRNIDLYRDEAGALGVEVLRYGRLEHDMKALLASIGAEFEPLPHAKRGLMSDSLDVDALLRRDQIDTINAVFAEEFDAFGHIRR